jgi:hypothetical protein
LKKGIAGSKRSKFLMSNSQKMTLMLKMFRSKNVIRERFKWLTLTKMKRNKFDFNILLQMMTSKRVDSFKELIRVKMFGESFSEGDPNKPLTQ